MTARIAKSLLLSSYLFFSSISAVLAQVVATAPASPSPTPTPIVGMPDGGATGSALPGAGISSPTIILLVLGSFFLILGGYKFFQAFKD